MLDFLALLRAPPQGMHATYDIVDVAHPANAALVAAVGEDILEPRSFYRKADRLAEYEAWVLRMQSERRAFLESYAVDADIIAATTGLA